MTRDPGEQPARVEDARVEWKPERFDCELQREGHGYMAYEVAVMDPWDDGEWVRYEDAKARVEALQSQLDRAEEALARADELADIAASLATSTYQPGDSMDRFLAALNRYLTTRATSKGEGA